MSNEIIKKIQILLQESHKITILTGAGISTESGIADFRSKGGVWSKYKTVTIQEFIDDPVKQAYYWKYKRETIPSMLEAKPNAAHYAIAELDKQGKLFWLLTQNIDGLHEKSGVRREKIVLLHGTNKEAICLQCHSLYPIEEILERIDNGEEIPHCIHCQGLLKPHTVSFGENLNPDHLLIAEKASKECDLFLALGSSLQVQPACSFVQVAATHNKPVIIINKDSTPYDSCAKFTIHDSLANILPKLISF